MNVGCWRLEVGGRCIFKWKLDGGFSNVVVEVGKVYFPLEISGDFPANHPVMLVNFRGVNFGPHFLGRIKLD